MSSNGGTRVALDQRLESDPNIFATLFGRQTDAEWRGTLIQSISDNVIDGVKFPTFPPDELQNRIHGHSGQHSLVEAFTFYDFVKANTFERLRDRSNAYFLDYGAGWGRNSRPFMRDFQLKRMFAYEPGLAFAAVGRACNPYINYVTGGYLPDDVLPAGKFSLAVGWSVFSHLSEAAATAWLGEMGRVLESGGQCVFTTWGLRFLESLQKVAQRMESGETVHWYQKLCVERAGSSLGELIDQYQAGKFVWFAASPGNQYGEAMISRAALETVIGSNGLPFEITAFDTNALPQDAFVLRRR